MVYVDWDIFFGTTSYIGYLSLGKVKNWIYSLMGKLNGPMIVEDIENFLMRSIRHQCMNRWQLFRGHGPPACIAVMRPEKLRKNALATFAWPTFYSSS